MASKKTKKTTAVKVARAPYIGLAALAALIAGLLHLTVVAAEHTSAIPEMLFFIALGVAQIFWAYWFYTTEKPRDTYIAGLIINGATLMVWFVSRMYQPPFGGDAEAFKQLDIIIATLQIAAIFISTYCVAMLVKQTERQKLWILALFVPLISGLFLFAGGVVTAAVFNLDTAAHLHEDSSVNDGSKDHHEGGSQNPEEETPHDDNTDDH